MHVYLRSEPGLWTVGHYAPDGSWMPESDHDSPDKAATRCHYLNGGNRDCDDDRETVDPADTRYYVPRD
jgi:hypothetical protein